MGQLNEMLRRNVACALCRLYQKRKLGGGSEEESKERKERVEERVKKLGVLNET